MTAPVYVADTLASLRDSFALHLHNTRAPKTTRIYLAALDGLIRHLEAQGMPVKAGAVRREHVESYLGSRRATVKPNTLSMEYRALQQFWRWALDEEEIDRSPMERIKAPKVPDAPVPVVSTADFQRLLHVTEGRSLMERRDTAMLLMLYDTGVRAGELMGLRLEDIDLRDRLAFVTGKGGHTRAVRFGTRTAVAIDRYLRLRRAHRHAGEPALWLGQEGPLSYSGLAQVIAKKCKAADLPRIHAHQFRHSFADSYLANGGQEGDLQRLAGWKSPLMLRRYGASRADERARAAYTSLADRL